MYRQNPESYPEGIELSLTFSPSDQGRIWEYIHSRELSEAIGLGFLPFRSKHNAFPLRLVLCGRLDQRQIADAAHCLEIVASAMRPPDLKLRFTEINWSTRRGLVYAQPDHASQLVLDSLSDQVAGKITEAGLPIKHPPRASVTRLCLGIMKAGSEPQLPLPLSLELSPAHISALALRGGDATCIAHGHYAHHRARLS